MFRFAGRRLHVAVTAVLLACAAGAWLRAGAEAPRAPMPPAAALPRVESLPLNLAPPLEPGVRLVALVASDIDADGDLDLVANDGSLDLLVWINDGAGHMTRRYARRTSGWRDDAPAATHNGQHDSVSTVASSSGSIAPQILSIAHEGRRAAAPVVRPFAATPWFARSRAPRAPPSILHTV